MIGYTIIVALSGFLSVAAQTPPGFKPEAAAQLTVTYDNQAIQPGALEPAKLVSQAPSEVGFSSAGNSTYVAILMDISVKLKPNAQPTTLLHWLQPALAKPAANGSMPVFYANQTLVPYYPPGPPDGQTHDYVLLLYRLTPEFIIPSQVFNTLANMSTNVNNRIGFNLTEFTEESRLNTDPAAANWFKVSGPSGNKTSSTVTASTPAKTSGSTSTTTATSTSRGSTCRMGGAGMFIIVLSVAFACCA